MQVTLKIKLASSESSEKNCVRVLKCKLVQSAAVWRRDLLVCILESKFTASFLLSLKT